MKKVAVTGGIASGKSTVLVLFQELGAYTIDADAIVHQLLPLHTDLGKRIVALLGDAVVIEGQLNRTAIARKVFRDLSLLKKLEEQIHPEVQKQIETHYERISQ